MRSGAASPGDVENATRQAALQPIRDEGPGRTKRSIFAEVVAGLEATTGEAVAAADLARVSPLANAHVIPSGTYRFPKAARSLE